MDDLTKDQFQMGSFLFSFLASLFSGVSAFSGVLLSHLICLLLVFSSGFKIKKWNFLVIRIAAHCSSHGINVQLLAS